jgi:flavin-dependent dehydrogenase
MDKDTHRHGENPSATVHISGAGPAGLAAALTIQKAGGKAIIHELKAGVGGRFHGDFQGLENWTTAGDVLEELVALGIASSYEHTPFRELVAFDPEGRESVYRSSEPLFYLVRRGPKAGTVDVSLRDQALASGAEIHFEDPQRHMPEGGIVADGPRGSDAVAVGYVFDTDLADGAFAAVSDSFAPKGYSYFLINKGRGTVASCFFEDYHNEKTYLDRTVALFQEKAGLRMSNERKFGGTGNFLVPRTIQKGNILFAGEAAGFQDALWGFGMRYAMLSGHLAARSLLEGKPENYDRLWKHRLGGLMRTSIVNRYLFEKLGDEGYKRFLQKASRNRDVRIWLSAFYAVRWWKSLLFPFAERAVRSSRKEAACPMEGCDCTWCRCQHETKTALEVAS